jgi:hypothetical protein
MSRYIALFSLLISTLPLGGLAQHQGYQGDPISEARNALFRVLDVSRQCELQTMELWSREIVKWISPFEIQCEVSPCNFTEVEPTFHAAYKAQCQDFGGQFVEYTYKFTQQWREAYYNITDRRLQENVYFEVFNTPVCIAKHCNSNQYASFLQGIRQNNERFDKGSIFIFAAANNESNHCFNQTWDLPMPETISPMDLKCARSLCDVKTTVPDYYASVKNTCQSINEKFVDYTFVVYKVLNGVQRPDASGIFYNYPKCISQNCSLAEDFASYYQGFFPAGVYIITQDFTIDNGSSSLYQTTLSPMIALVVSLIGLWII